MRTVYAYGKSLLYLNKYCRGETVSFWSKRDAAPAPNKMFHTEKNVFCNNLNRINVKGNSFQQLPIYYPLAFSFMYNRADAGTGAGSKLLPGVVLKMKTVKMLNFLSSQSIVHLLSTMRPRLDA
jgi:hypothetical protein